MLSPDDSDLAAPLHPPTPGASDDPATGSAHEVNERGLTDIGPGSLGRTVATPWASNSEVDPVDRRLALARSWDDLLAEVRALPGFETFLRPPTYKDLLRAAAHGPVVTINVSEWRCDALFLTSDGVEAVSLPDLSLRDAERHLERHLAALARFDQSVAEFEAAVAVLQRDHSDRDAIRLRQEAGARRRQATLDLDEELTELVGWLWDVVMVPLLDRLPAPGTDDLRPRVWWCPTGPLAFLPLHAAGRGTQWLHDMVVSSTTPTVRSLLDARTDSSTPSRDTGTPTRPRRRFLVASTFASTGELLTGSLSRLTATDIVECSDVVGVRRQLETCDFVHFDCHGDQVLADPSQGGVRLSDGVLRVFDVSSISATGEFAALAACKTAVGGVDLLDEAITLSAALHYAGFRHVVGTLWNLAESVAQSAFAAIYDQLVTDQGSFDPINSARALASSVDQLRADGESLHSWASLIHIGP
ncbi:CHAT domain-containing protein [Rhodococcoides fascians]|uniref:CHAT domain-containing protein n=1 Tax=Rhodococcoides fascians TaxID=1828 RepID=UPI00050C327B|nr:CHAT domain-containing protein [Rhodococcus fascians]